ncbi:hypothetical protein [Terrimonas pollutisoli]|uniref:hypothetical protein n=1 Tax=Terrimonas pollutisoli TaxID=3034147 RepID=UPI0023ED0214|nr:hypothetical protein [Terrimonas sp. H1YJ31]
MSPKSLFLIILKVFGLFFIKDFLATIPQVLAAFLYLTNPDLRTEAIWMILSTLATLTVYWFVCYYLIFRSEQIIEVLNLDKGFSQDTFSFNIHRSTVLSISIILVGGLLIVFEIPNFCKQLFGYFQETRLTGGQTNPTLMYTAFSGIKIVIGLFLIVGQRQIVNFIELRRKN